MANVFHVVVKLKHASLKNSYADIKLSETMRQEKVTPQLRRWVVTSGDTIRCFIWHPYRQNL